MQELTAGNEDEGCAGVDDAGSRVEDGGVAAVADRLVNTPVLARGGGGGQGPVYGSMSVRSNIEVQRKRTRRRCRRCTWSCRCRRR